MSERLRYLVYRCYRCSRLLTKLEILAAWEESEATQSSAKGTCPCGSRHLTPTNPTPEEYEELGSEEQHQRYLDGVRDYKTRLWELKYKEVDGKTLDPDLYPESK